MESPMNVDDNNYTQELRPILWDDAFSVHVPKIDEEHQSLFRLYNSLVEAILANVSFEDIESKRDQLHNYTNTHFQNEIKALEKIRPPINAELIKRHKEEHDGFIRRMSVLSIRMDMSKDKKPLIYEFCQSLADLVQTHILTTDLESFNSERK
jgi:hemerythrin-like metal-binding protein